MHDKHQGIPRDGLCHDRDVFLGCIFFLVARDVARVDDHVADAVDQVYVGAVRAAVVVQFVNSSGEGYVLVATDHHSFRKIEPDGILGTRPNVAAPFPGDAEQAVHHHVPERRRAGGAVDEREIVERQPRNLKIFDLFRLRNLECLTSSRQEEDKK